jgi:hypothetical protein
MITPEAAPPVQASLARLLCALSPATDVGMGQMLEHGLKSAYIGLRLAGATRFVVQPGEVLDHPAPEDVVDGMAMDLQVGRESGLLPPLEMQLEHRWPWRALRMARASAPSPPPTTGSVSIPSDRLTCPVRSRMSWRGFHAILGIYGEQGHLRDAARPPIVCTPAWPSVAMLGNERRGL